MMKKILHYEYMILLMACVMGKTVHAGTTGILEGKTRDKGTGEMLFGVNVMVLGTKLGTASDRNGFLRINNIPAGMYTVQFQMMGYRTVNVENVEIRPDLRTRLDEILMEQAPVEMDAIVVRAERPLIQKDITGSTITVSSSRMDQLPVSQFEEILAMQAGVTAEGNVRGGKAEEVLYLVDGLPVQDMISGGLGAHLPRNSVQQMEIQTGGFDSEYGNALSGIVNVITKSGSEDFHAMLRGETDNFHPYTKKDRATRIEGSVSGPVLSRHLFYHISADAYVTGTRWWQDFEKWFSSPVMKQGSVLGRIDGQINRNMLLSAQFLYNTKNWHDYEYSWRYRLDGLPVRKSELYWGSVQWSHMLSKKTYYALDMGYYQVLNRTGAGSKEEMALFPYEYDFFLQYIINGERSWWTDMKQGIGIIRGNVTSQINTNHLFKGGFEFHHYNIFGDIVKYEPQMTFFGKPMLDEPLLNFSTIYRYYPYSGSVYIQDKWTLSDEGGVISAGLRYDFLDPRAERPEVEFIATQPDEYTGQVNRMVKASFKAKLSPRIGFSAPLSERSFFFANIGTYTQFPLFHYLYAGLDNVTLRSGMNVLKGNPDLKPETSLIWEISMKYTIPWDGVLSVTYFSKQSENQIDTKTFVPSNSRIAGDYGFAEYVNNDRTEARGIEVNATKERGKWIQGSVSYTYMTAKGISGSSEQGIEYFQWGFPLTSRLNYLSWDQRHTLKANINLLFPWGMGVNLYLYSHSPRPFTYFPSRDGFQPEDPDAPFAPNNERMDYYHELDLKVSQIFSFNYPWIRKASLYMDVRNLLDNRNVIWMDASGRIGGELWDPGAYSSGRRACLGIEWQF